MTHSLRALHHTDENGLTWVGVNVCSEKCDRPGPGPGQHGKSFSVDEPCRNCGAPGVLEWRQNSW